MRNDNHDDDPTLPEWCWDFYIAPLFIPETNRFSFSLGTACIDPDESYNAPGTTGIANFLSADQSIVKEILPLFKDIF